jgi:hypothetical protein
MGDAKGKLIYAKQTRCDDECGEVAIAAFLRRTIAKTPPMPRVEAVTGLQQ